MPTLDDVRKLARFIKNASDTEYVFSKLNSTDWIPFLVSEGLFSSPYQPVPEENGFLLPAWPQSRFLARLAAAGQSRPNQEVLLETALGIPETQNVRVHGDLIDVALRLDPDLSSRLVPKASEWIRGSFRLTLPLKMGALISHLAKGDQVDAAILLAKSVLEMNNRQPSTSESGARFLGEPMPLFDVWEYEQILVRNVPDLLNVTPERTLTFLCELLDTSILRSDRDGAERRPQDLSHVWRPAIEDHPQNLGLGVRNLLVTAVRDAAVHEARTDPKSASSVIDMLDKRGESWLVFRRISLHVILMFPHANPDLFRLALVNRENFESVGLRHEYFLLEKECFRELSRDEQQLILGWITEGPKYTESQLKRWEEFTQRTWTDEDKSRFSQEWKRDRLAALEKHLNEEWKQIYAKLVSAEGKPRHPEFTSYHEGGARGPSSPCSQEGLAKLSAKEMVVFLSDWKPPSDWPLAPSPEGLGRQLTEVVSGAPERYALDGEEFRKLSEPTYARAIVQGFQNALTQKRKFDWPPVIDFCAWAVDQKREIPGRTVEHFESDPHWGWARTAVLRLLNDGFTSEANPIPLELREKVWSSIEPVTHDSEPTPVQEQEYWDLSDMNENKTRGRAMGSKTFDPFTYSLNTARGVAIEAVVRYALWVRSGFEKLENNATLLSAGLSGMPEVRDVLNFHLDAEEDSSVTVRTVYGYRVPWLQLLDERWARENGKLIFPRANPMLWHASWDTYIGFSPPYDNVFVWLRDEYLYAVKQIGNHDHGWAQAQSPDYSLAQHLMSFYWRGKLQYDSEILATFFLQANVKLRGYALNFIGRTLRNTEGAISNNMAEALKYLWTKRVQVATTLPKEDGVEEFQEYGWWFASAKFDDDWSLTQLSEAMRLAGRIEPDFLVVGRLAEIATEKPLQCVRALATIIEVDTKRWGVQGWSDKAKDIIRAALHSGDSAARKSAEDLVNLLGSRGYFDFGDLLKEEPN